jgi:hypothetical protein
VGFRGTKGSKGFKVFKDIKEKPSPKGEGIEDG